MPHTDGETAPLLRLAGVSKSFPGVQALRGAALDLRAGEIHALVGENGAGKSTLIRIVTGAHAPDAGVLELDGAPVTLSGPADALRRGIAAIYQEFSLVAQLPVRDNLFLGREPARWGFVAAAEERRRARELCARLALDVDLESRTGALDLARQQLVEIARALLAEARVLILDEPTAALTGREVERLFDILRGLRARGIAILFISHRLEEVLRLADRVTVLRDGQVLGTWAAPETSRERLVELMVGRPLDQEFPSRQAPVAGAAPPVVLRVHGVSGGRVQDVSFDVRAGEVLGIAGLVGAGRTDLARLVFGADRRTAGDVLVDGRAVPPGAPRAAIARGLALLTEDRKGQGLVLQLGARDNFALPNLSHWSRRGWIARRREASTFAKYITSLRIRLADPGQPARDLSGGNQQKLLVARWLESDARALIFDEPTRGIDVGAKYEIYGLVNELAARGKAVVVISSELPEILGMSDRVLVMRAGRVAGEVTDVRGATQQDLLALAVGAA